MFELLITTMLIVVGYLAGHLAEKRHYRSIHLREARYLQLPTTTLNTHPEELEIEKIMLVHGSVAISMDYFKRFVMSFKKLFGGRLGMYETLLDRGRREAVLRMKENGAWADTIINLRMETSSIGGQGQGKKNKVRSIEVFAFGTAIKYRKRL